MTDSPTSRRTLAWLAFVIVVAVLVYLPALWTGFLADDVYQIALFDGVAGQRSPWALYSLFELDPSATGAHMQRGSLPWWTTHDFKFVQLRPLSSLLLALDHTLAHHNAVVHHVHSMLWLIATVVAARYALRGSTSASIAAVALLVFAIDESLGWTVAWLANRCTLVAATFGLWALGRMVRHDGAVTPRKRGAELLLWVLAFAAGEYALCVLAYALAYTLVGRTDAWKTRLLGMAPALLALGLFTVVYVAIGAGVSSDTSYIDPLRHPGALAVAMFERVPRMLGEVLLALPAETDRLLSRTADSWVSTALATLGGIDDPAQMPWAHGRIMLAALVVVLVPGWLLARRQLSADERRAVRWMSLGTVGAVMPLAAIMPSTRALAIAGLGPAVVVGSIIVAAGRAIGARPVTANTRLHAAVLGLWAAALGWQHIIADALWTEVELAGVLATGRAYETFHTNLQLDPVALEGKHVVVLSSPGLVTGLHGQWMMHRMGRPMPATWHVLSVGQRRLIVRRFDDRTLELSTVQQALLDQPQETLFRNPTSPMRTGDSIDVRLFRAEIMHERTVDGPNSVPVGPDSVHFVFDRSLDDPSVVFLETGPTGLRPFPMPALHRSAVLAPPDLPALRRGAPR